MSVDLGAYVRTSQLPSFAVLRPRMEQAGVTVMLPETRELTSICGFVPVRFDGADSGFEVSCSAITEHRIARYKKALERAGEQHDEYLEMLMACDRSITFACKPSDPRELAAARIVANVVASASAGWFEDQNGLMTRYAPRIDAVV